MLKTEKEINSSFKQYRQLEQEALSNVLSPSPGKTDKSEVSLYSNDEVDLPRETLYMIDKVV